MNLVPTRRAGLGALAFGAVLALVGCSTSPAASSSGEEGGGAASDVVLTLAGAGEAPAQAAIDAFEAANPGVTVDATFANDDESYQQTLRTQLSGGTAPDVFRVWPGNGNATSVLPLSDDGLLAPLDDAEWADSIGDAVRPVVEDADGGLVGVPVTVVGIGAVWNDQAVEAAGLTVPDTYTEVLQFCADAKAAGKIAFALGLKSTWVTQLVPYALTATSVYGPDPDFTKKQLAGETTFVDSAWKDAQHQYLEMRDAGCFNDSPNGIGYDEQMTMLGKGEALGAVHITSAAANAQQYAPEGTTFSMTPFPATDDAAETMLPVSVGIVYAVNAKAKNPQLAKKFVDFLASSEGQAVYATAAGAAPALESSDFEPDEVLAAVGEFQAAGKARPFPDVAWPNTKVQQEHLAGIQELFNDTIGVDELLTRMDEAFNEG
ncbi:ABC transporter substrate-binding protein [Microbacterium stercoris]|uniref:Carbohydrate ABC transporter substrate-binding protein n=1 Tax=Microbacterium stercoris TaxID=2820289 RepID=A0A939QFZ4_9MICO|nr:ABC transporter substrate-binding protein [Microbacterium stercoris]MBO3662239.1 carbohydrate ABC transporter substrate-binding protein [Microbacterium stercoris]